MFALSIPVFGIVTTWFAYVPAHPAVAIHGVFESLKAPPAGWAIQDRPVDGSTILFLRLHLRQQNVAEFEQMVYDISTPGHPSYGEHMTQYAVNNILQPAEQTLKLVTDWFSPAGTKSAPSLDSNFLNIKTTVSKAELLLHVEYAFFRNEANGKVVLRTLGYSPPLKLHELVDMIHPTTYFPSVNAMKTTVVGCKEIRSANCVKALYGFEDFTPPTGHGNKFAIAGYLEEYVRDDDLAIFEEIYANETVRTEYEFISVVGGLNTQYWGQDTIESAIDVQYRIASKYSTPVSYYQTTGCPPINLSLQTTSDDSEPYLQWLTFMLALNDTELPPSSQDLMQTKSKQSPSPTPKLSATCSLSSQLAVSRLSSRPAKMGQVVCASLTTERTRPSSFRFPCFLSFRHCGRRYPTHRARKWHLVLKRRFLELLRSSAYQESTVSSYVQKYGKWWAPYFNASGRTYPDVSAQGTNVGIIYWGGHRYEAGTSFSTPIFASVISLINSDRLSKGFKLLGFLNPWLYSSASAGLQDILSGGSTGYRSTYPGANILGAG
ncbi:hypothetical protein BDZ45DRAFT_720413 [Acephala macrosclerotiorum]|nr:hypothetical protein BDZ45DRAFT_720413 [Acephala macrosclerotiorum]